MASIINDFQDRISLRLQEGQTDAEILAWLRSEGVTISQATLTRRYQDWGLRRHTTFIMTQELIDQVQDLYLKHLLSDSKIAALLTDAEGNSPTTNQVKAVRMKHHIQRRVKINNADNDQVSTDRYNATLAAVTQLITIEGGRSFGYRWIQTTLRSRYGHHARMKDVQQALRLLDPEGVYRRNPHTVMNPPLTRQENYVTLGPDEIWSCDGHDKLAYYGFQIYAGIDAYARRVIWLYCGNASRSSVAYLYQYLQVVKEHGECPRFLRTDKGGETVLFAALHYHLFLQALQTENNNIEADGMNAGNPTCCFIWGSSPRNVRIERVWYHIRHAITARWEELFRFIERERLYRPHSPTDCVVIQFVFMRLLRHKLEQFVLTKNTHRIRKQNNRSRHIAGIPDELYYREGRRYGFPTDPAVLAEWESYLEPFDFDSYLTAESMAWCERIMHQLGHPTHPTTAEFFTLQGQVIPEWYYQLVYATRAHQEVVAEICQAMNLDRSQWPQLREEV